MIVPVWRCDAEAPVALLPPAPLRPLSVTDVVNKQMDDRSNRSRSGALHQPYLLPTFFLKMGRRGARPGTGWLAARILLADF